VNIRRKQSQQSQYFAYGEAINYCLDTLEKAKKFNDKLDFSTNIVPNLTLEELIGALVFTEEQLKHRGEWRY